ncbi:BQ5605_C040g11850 [Microbotryum silenes-dioicae]|uniref:BQ5605_C040g11850 protein n=1 Tax=Microbotryum silenes-dioicae TaxID=796604 RepID=A0A2X0MQQ9_9BASI|nr:BQ5605_C040g11850 [Microbotryum silenes-dioicae]
MLYNHLRTHLIVAPSTSVGKSIFSTGLCRASLAQGERVGYLKPIGTGTGDGDDELHLKRFAPRLSSTKCLFHFDEPVSPHLAVARSGSSSSAASKYPTDDTFVRAISHHVHQFAQDPASAVRQAAGRGASLYIESAGGVHSPVLSGSSQIDAFRPLAPPSTLLISSHALGGISTTLSAYESLLIRGYRIDSVLVFKEDYYENYSYFQKWFEQERGIKVGIAPLPPSVAEPKERDEQNMDTYYATLEENLSPVIDHLRDTHQRRLDELASMGKRSRDVFWWPFVQHNQVARDQDVMVVDSAHGDHFVTLDHKVDAASSKALLSPTFDGSASWWTQALGHSNPTLALAAAQAAGRYGHVLFPSATNEPSLRLAENLVRGVGQGWAERVFYSDDGSTGMEVGLKMALRSYAVRRGLNAEDAGRLKVLGFKGSYHGDTIGVVDACEKSIFTERIDWYNGRGAWLDGSQVMLEQGKVVIRDRKTGQSIGTYNTLKEIYDVDQRLKDDDSLVERYRHEIAAFVREHHEAGTEFGALVLEPIVMGAGGMIFIDPLFQRVLIDLVRGDSTLFPSCASRNASTASSKTWQGLPVIFDEVFVGLHRIGPLTSARLLGSTTYPDIAVYAKILSGGLVPLSVTLASGSIFETFLGPGKVDALLHGHSYTAHPVGCNVALTTLNTLEKMQKRGDWDAAKQNWGIQASAAPPHSSTTSAQPWSLWSAEFVDRVSRLEERVSGVMALGTLLVVYLRTSSAGYDSAASVDLLARLKDAKIPGGPSAKGYNVHARPLGNVVYFMTSLNSKLEDLRALEGALWEALLK